VKGRLDVPSGVVGAAALVVELYGNPLDGLIPTDVAATVGGVQPV
jgi:hypothetical protein